MTSFSRIPDPLQEKVFAAVPTSAHPEALLHLACVNKAFAAQLRQPSADVWWEAAWASAKRMRPAAATEEQKANPALSFKTRDKLRLAGFNGCMLCGAKSIRKVYWEFSIRCCKDCLIEHSLAENTLKHTFKLQLSTFQHLPHREVQMYKPHAGSFTFNTYWKPHLLPILQEEYGVQSFEEYTQHQKQQEQVKETKRQDRKDLLQEWCRQDSIDLSEADRYSSIYRRNCHLAVPLKRKGYEQLLPRITEEINQGCAEAEAKLKRQKLPDRLFRLLEPSSSKTIPEPSSKPQQHRTSSGKPGTAARQSFAKKDLICPKCGGSRLFSTQGLADHTKAKHS
ncbi:TPA: hypothetical protein ACH3X2_008320 [Trebouxia sp. C0005]|nr:MAG: hypothetical protein FRX49_09253 [Trebouxia sp. A1-2]